MDGKKKRYGHEYYSLKSFGKWTLLRVTSNFYLWPIIFLGSLNMESRNLSKEYANNIPPASRNRLLVDTNPTPFIPFFFSGHFHFSRFQKLEKWKTWEISISSVKYIILTIEYLTPSNWGFQNPEKGMKIEEIFNLLMYITALVYLSFTHIYVYTISSSTREGKPHKGKRDGIGFSYTTKREKA